MSFPATARLRVVGPLTTLLTAALLAATAGCSRDKPPAADTANAAKAPATTAAVPGGTAPGNATVATSAPAGGPGAPGGPNAPAANPAMAAAAKKAADDRARLAAAEAVPVEIGPVTRGPINAFLTFNSTLETEATVDIYPQTSGQVEALLAEEGKIVAEGDPLLKIEDRELRVDAEESAANFAHEDKAFARMKDVFERGMLNKQEFDDAAYRHEQSRLRNERAKLRLSYATVRAPFAGVVSSRDTQVGARVGSGTKVFSLVKLDEIVARVFVPGRYLSVVAENQPAVVTSEFLPNRTFTGWVKRISPVIDPKSGTFKVTIGVRGDKPSELPPGLFVGVRVITDTRKDALLISKRAVVYEGGERYVFAVVKDKAVKRKLVAGYEDPTSIEALSGFEVGAPVIVLGQAGLKDGAMVRVVNAPAGPTPGTAPAAKPALDPKAEEAKAAPATAPKQKPGE